MEVLSNKVASEGLLGYVTIPIPDDGVITLPREVEVPLKINIDGNPSFSRDRLYEFTQNGPGSETERVGWTWEDKGTTPLFRDIPEGETLTVNSSAADDGKQITFTFLGTPDAAVNDRFKSTLTLNHLAAPVVPFVFSTPIAVAKDITAGYVTVLTVESSTILAQLSPQEADPSYRRIRLSKKGGTAYILFRRNRFNVYSQTDFIPIRSKMGLLLMVKSLEAFRQERFDVAKSLKEEAVALATEEQTLHNSFIDLSKDSEVGTIMNLNFQNTDTIVTGDIYDEACKILGPLGQQKVLDQIGEAVSILSNKAQWDAQRGYVDIETDQYHYVTLPRYVDTVIELNICGRPADMKNKWFQFTLSGPGSDYTPCQSWQDDGRVVTLRDAPYTQRLSAVPDLPSDDGKEIWVYGYYGGKRIFTTDTMGVTRDGFPVPVDITTENVSTQNVDVIERIVKPTSQGFIKLMGRNTLDAEVITLGYYWPDETEPSYRRIKIGTPASTIRLMYRRKNLRYTTFFDPINLRSKTAILSMLRSLSLMGQGKITEADAMEKSAVKLLVEENSMSNQSEVMNIDFGLNFTASDQFIPFA